MSLRPICEQTIAARTKAALSAKAKSKRATKVVHLVSVLQESIQRAQTAKKKPARKAPQAA